MGRFRTWHAGLALALGLAAVVLVSAAEPPGDRAPAGGNTRIDPAQLRPQWRPGQAWEVETRTLAVQAREEPAKVDRSPPIPWRFTVQDFEKVGQDDCYRVEVKCLLPGPPQPTTVLWIDKKSETLRQISTQVPVPGGFAVLTENYRPVGGQATPVLGPLTALPVDLPLFQGGTKGLDKFTYQADSGPAGQKAIGDVGFITEVEQEIRPARPNQVKGLIDERFAKGLEDRPAVEVRLKKFDRQVHQFWRPGLPWPAYTDDGCTVSRLVKVLSN